MTQRLHFIKKIRYIECSRLKNAIVAHGSGVYLRFWRNFIPLPIVGLASCEVTSEIQDGTTIYTSRLTAALRGGFDPAGHSYAFLIETIDGSRFLLGSGEKPYPAVTVSDIMPSSVSERACASLMAEWTDTTGLLPVLD